MCWRNIGGIGNSREKTMGSLKGTPRNCVAHDANRVKQVTTLKLPNRGDLGNDLLYGNAAEGLGVIELKSQDKKASAEIHSLCQEIFEHDIRLAP